MTIILLAVLAAIVYFAERLAFAILLYIGLRIVLRWAEPRLAKARLVWDRYSNPIRHFVAMWLLRRQLAAGATP